MAADISEIARLLNASDDDRDRLDTLLRDYMWADDSDDNDDSNDGTDHDSDDSSDSDFDMTRTDFDDTMDAAMALPEIVLEADDEHDKVTRYS